MPDWDKLKREMNEAIDSGTFGRKESDYLARMLAKLDRGLALSQPEYSTVQIILFSKT